MSRTVTEKLMYLDATGKAHPYRSWAEQANLWDEMLELFSISSVSDTADVVNRISSNKKLVREYLDACDAMEADVYK